MTLLQIQDLETYYHTDGRDVHAVDGVSVSVAENETLGVVGESGSGKSTFGKSIIRTLPDNASIVNGSISFEETDLTSLSEKQLNEFRWSEISLIPQSAMNSLDPVYTVGDQMIEAASVGTDTSKKEARAKAIELFDLVGLDEERLDEYPHQFSGGMKQRALIALSLILDPKLIIADEPTTALDVITQQNILNKIDVLRHEMDLSMILISHDISVVSERSDKIAIFYGGRIVEYGETAKVIENPRHPYTIGLKNAFPTLGKKTDDLTSIPGSPPELLMPSDECRFVDRCPFAVDECSAGVPELVEVQTGHFVECIRSGDPVLEDATNPATWAAMEDSQ